jgi:hypothetical protein
MSENNKDGGITGKGWKKGQSGNPKGRPKGKTIASLLRQIIEDNDGKIADALAKKAIQSALEGDFRFWNEIIERLDGKVPNRLEGSDGSVLTFMIQEAEKPNDNAKPD